MRQLVRQACWSVGPEFGGWLRKTASVVAAAWFWAAASDWPWWCSGAAGDENNAGSDTTTVPSTDVSHCLGWPTSVPLWHNGQARGQEGRGGPGLAVEPGACPGTQPLHLPARAAPYKLQHIMVAGEGKEGWGMFPFSLVSLSILQLAHKGSGAPQGTLPKQGIWGSLDLTGRYVYMSPLGFPGHSANTGQLRGPGSGNVLL